MERERRWEWEKEKETGWKRECEKLTKNNYNSHLYNNKGILYIK